MVTIRELRDWLANVWHEDGGDGMIAIDEGGLTLVVVGSDPEQYLEVGGDDYDAEDLCEACGRVSLDCSKDPCPRVIHDRGECGDEHGRESCPICEEEEVTK